MALPFLPFFAEGKVIKGFGRGSRSLGIPTANFDEDVVRNIPAAMESGVYYGFANIDGGPVSKMVCFRTGKRLKYRHRRS